MRKNQRKDQSKNQSSQSSSTSLSGGDQAGSAQGKKGLDVDGLSKGDLNADGDANGLDAQGLVVPDVPRQMTMGSIVSDSSMPESNTEEMDDAWDTVALPGTVTQSGAIEGGVETGPSKAASKPGLSTVREQELLTLIHDLNNCNDVLLAKVSKLEAALGESQQSVRSEVERSQATQEKMLEQVLEQQTVAQQTAQTAQQQVAKLVGQLDTAEQSLQRQALIQETLRAELHEAQERINQLEHECALITQQHADEAQARIKAETTNRDLRSRLQRQQHYTLQFKVALEKSLSVTTRSATAANASVVSDPVSFNEDSAHGLVTMPKAERIVPWNAVSSAPFAGIDPHLENLIRRQADSEAYPTSDLDDRQSGSVHSESQIERAIGEVSNQPQSVATENAPVPVVDGEAEAKLWQDIERVMSSAAEVTGSRPAEVQTEVQTAGAEATDTKATDLNATDAKVLASENAERADTALNSEPRLNWQAQSALPIDPTTVPAAATIIDSTTSPAAEPTTAAPQPVADLAAGSAAVDSSSVGLAAASEQPPKVQLPKRPQTAKASQAEKSADYLPLVDGEASTVSPVVNPLRTQRKIGSMAAVQLPTFEKAKAGSFKR